MHKTKIILLFLMLTNVLALCFLVSCVHSDEQVSLTATSKPIVQSSTSELTSSISQDSISEHTASRVQGATPGSASASTSFSVPINHNNLDKRVKVGVTIGAFDDNTMVDVRNKIESYFWDLSVDDVIYEATILDAKHDVEVQLSQIDTFITQEFDVLIIDLLNYSKIGDITEKVKAANIPVVFLHYEPTEEEINAWDKLCFIGFDYNRSGIVQGEIVASLPNNGDVNNDGIVSYVMIEGDPDYRHAQNITEYSIKALTDRGIEVEELLKQSGYWDQYQAYDIAASAISLFGNRIDVILCNNDYMAIGASRAIVEAGRIINKDIYLIGWDAMYEAIDMVNDGLLTGTVLIDDESRGRATAEAAVNFVQGKSNDKYIWIDYVPIVADLW